MLRHGFNPDGLPFQVKGVRSISPQIYPVDSNAGIRAAPVNGYLRNHNVGPRAFLDKRGGMADKGHCFSFYLCDTGQFITFKIAVFEHKSRITRVAISTKLMLQGVTGLFTTCDREGFGIIAYGEQFSIAANEHIWPRNVTGHRQAYAGNAQ